MAPTSVSTTPMLPQLHHPHTLTSASVGRILSRNMNGTVALTTHPSNESELQLFRVLQRANLLSYYDTFISKGGDDVQQLCDSGQEEFLEIMDLVGMAAKPLHVRRLQKTLREWLQNPGLFQTPLVSLDQVPPGPPAPGPSGSHQHHFPHLLRQTTSNASLVFGSPHPVLHQDPTTSPSRHFPIGPNGFHFGPGPSNPGQLLQGCPSTDPGSANNNNSQNNSVFCTAPLSPSPGLLRENSVQSPMSNPGSDGYGNPSSPSSQTFALTEEQIQRLADSAEKLVKSLPPMDPKLQPQVIGASSKKRMSKELENILNMSEEDSNRLDAIRKYSAIYGRFDCKRKPQKPLSLHEISVNEAAAQLCKLLPNLLTRRDELFPMARKVVRDSGYQYSKGHSRSQMSRSFCNSRDVDGNSSEEGSEPRGSFSPVSNCSKHGRDDGKGGNKIIDQEPEHNNEVDDDDDDEGCRPEDCENEKTCCSSSNNNSDGEEINECPALIKRCDVSNTDHNFRNPVTDADGKKNMMKHVNDDDNDDDDNHDDVVDDDDHNVATTREINVEMTDQTENHSTDARRRSKEPRPASGASAPSPTPRPFCSGSRKRRTTSTSSSRSLSRHFRSDDQDSGTNAESAEERMGNPSPQTFTIRANTAPGGSDANSEVFHQRIPQQTFSQQLQYLQQPRFHHTSFIQPEFIKQQILAQSSSSSGSNAETLTHFMAVAAAVNFQNQLRFRMQPNCSVNPEVKQEPASP